MATITSGPGSTYTSEEANLDDYSVREPVERALYYEYGRAHIFGDGDVPGLSSTDGSSIVHVKEELVSGPGQTIGFNLIRNIGGPGVRSSTELENREDIIDTADCRVKIDQHRHGLKSGDRITRQGLTWGFVETALPLLAAHARTMDEIWMLTQGGNYDATATLSTYYDNGGTVIDPTDVIWTGLNSTLVLDSDHLVHCSADHTDETNYDSDDYLDRKYLLEAVAKNDQLLNPVRPVNIGGEDKFVVVVNTNVGRRIRESDTEWYALMKANLGGSLATKAWPAFTGRLLGEYENCILISSSFVPPGIAGGTAGAPVSNVFRNQLLGAQAFGKAYGKITPGQNRLGLVHGDRDHKNIEYLSYYRLCGIQLTQFKDRSGTARNHGSMVLPSFATRPSITS